MDVKETRHEVSNWMHLVQKKDQSLALPSVMNILVA
jgi:hypothetical protein